MQEKTTAAATWLGRHQAFAVIAAKSTLAQAQCLRELRNTRAYESLGMTWEQFCQTHAGMARVTADRLIRRLDEFGENYFKLTALVSLSDATYRKLEPQVRSESIQLCGANIPLLAENAPKIRAGIQEMREKIHELQIESNYLHAGLGELHRRLEDVLAEFRERARFPTTRDDRHSFAAILRYTIDRMIAVEKEFKRPAA